MKVLLSSGKDPCCGDRATAAGNSHLESTDARGSMLNAHELFGIKPLTPPTFHSCLFMGHQNYIGAPTSYSFVIPTWESMSRAVASILQSGKESQQELLA